MRSDLQHLIGSPLEQALKAAADQGFFPEVLMLQMHSRRAEEEARSPHLIAIRDKLFIAGDFVLAGPRTVSDG